MLPPKASGPEQGLLSPSEKTTGSKSAGSVCRLSSILEPDSERVDTDDSRGGHDWGGSIFSLRSDKLKTSSGSCFSSDDSHSGGTSWSQLLCSHLKTRAHSSSLFIFSSLPDDCALLLLSCLHCRFYDFMVLLPGAFEGAVSRCFPLYRHVRLATEREQQEKDCCISKMELDCNCCGSCKDTGEFIEFAMEISEVCYH